MRKRGLLAALTFALAAFCMAPVEGAAAQAATASYVEGARGELDIYAPQGAPEAGEERAPVIVYFYGGGWQFGEKARAAFVGEALSAQGFVLVIPDYRVWPEVRFHGPQTGA